jgi:hypothetical protein
MIQKIADAVCENKHNLTGKYSKLIIQVNGKADCEFIEPIDFFKQLITVKKV